MADFHPRTTLSSSRQTEVNFNKNKLPGIVILNYLRIFLDKFSLIID